jgi:glycosyltransferase involved in cell wall biosynthesis
MKVLIVSNTAPEDKVSGLGRYARELAGALSRAGVPTTLVVKRVHAGSPAAELAPDGVRIVRHPVPSKANPLFAGAYPLYTARGVLGALRAHAGPDTVVHAHFAVSALPLALAGAPYLYTFHAPVWRELLDERQDTYHLPGWLERPAQAGVRATERIVLRRAVGCYVLSAFMREHLRALHPGDEPRVELLAGGVDLRRFAPDPNAQRAPDDAPLLFTARRLTPRNGVDRLICALPAILAEHPGAELAIAGVGEMELRLRTLAAGLGVSGQVRFLGYLSDRELVDAYRRATLVVMPTVKLEGFGLTLAEALACGTPVLGTPVGAIPELLRAVDPALLSADNSPAALAAAVNRLLGAPDRLRELGARGRDVVAPAMGWDAISQRYLQAYEALLARRRR